MISATGRVAVAVAIVSAATSAAGAEIVLTRSADEKLVVQSLFRDQGRYGLSQGPCTAYFQTPSVRLADGRVSIRAHLSGRVGAALGGECLGIAVSEWMTVSGRPAPLGGQVRLVDIRVDEARDELRSIARLALQAMPAAIEIDVAGAVRRMLQDAAGKAAVETDLESLTIGSIVAADDRLTVSFDFRLVGR